jgi:hypothetical protein
MSWMENALPRGDWRLRIGRRHALFSTSATDDQSLCLQRDTLNKVGRLDGSTHLDKLSGIKWAEHIFLWGHSFCPASDGIVNRELKGKLLEGLKEQASMSDISRRFFSPEQKVAILRFFTNIWSKAKLFRICARSTASNRWCFTSGRDNFSRTEQPLLKASGPAACSIALGDDRWDFFSLI